MKTEIDEAKAAALEVLRHNAHGPYRGLPRTAGWGYPEPYTRDLMIAALGILVSGDETLMRALRRTLEVVADNQSPRGHIPSLVHDADDRGASDTTPLFLMAAAMFRDTVGEPAFLQDAIEKAVRWMEYQSPADDGVVAQLPTSDWRDEQWVLGYGLYVNTVVYTYQRLLGLHGPAETLRNAMSHFTITGGEQHKHVHEGLVIRHKPYYALWSYKVLGSERVDLLGNSLAILSGIAAPSRAEALVRWIESECEQLRDSGLLAVELPPNLFPYLQPGDPDWHPRDALFNQPGEYHNGGIWPFVCGFYIAALVAAGRPKLAARRLDDLTALVRRRRKEPVEWGFNEWYRAQDGTARGQDWQTWSAAMYLYAARCVEENRTPFFEAVRRREHDE
ncbi:glycoside hydrolase 100 family protein [Pontiella sp.]|uniref:glycoside hydrolase 100 family protein n=1 Tax=Pontiella sp. TaxID=2837462 RepID=UPI00356263A9